MIATAETTPGANQTLGLSTNSLPAVDVVVKCPTWGLLRALLHIKVRNINAKGVEARLSHFIE